MAKQFSPIFLGKMIDAIWHTGLVVYGKEYYFGGGICAGTPKTTVYGYPIEVISKLFRKENWERQKFHNQFLKNI